MKFKTCRKCKEDFFSENKLYAYLKSFKKKIKNVNQIINEINKNSQKTLIIIIINFIIILINENEFNINKQKKIKERTYFVNLNYFIIESISKKTLNIKLAFKK